MKYHAGELEVQARAGARQTAGRVSGVMRSTIPEAARQFLHSQTMVIAASMDPSGHLWASILQGSPGFIRVVDAKTVDLKAGLPKDDPLLQNLQTHPQIGLLAIEFATRRRAKLKGEAKLEGDRIIVRLNNIYALCPKYIQAREPEQSPAIASTVYETSRFNELSPEQRDWISRTDTFFIASYHPETGADASHRGGNPGFVRIDDSHRILFPDYSGNKMFNTLGNITANPNAGLLFPNFDSGNTLQATGKARVLWNDRRMREFPGAERLVEFQISELRETKSVLARKWILHDYSPFNPA